MIVIDTHILLWWVGRDNALSINAHTVIKDALETGDKVLISCISAWEIAMLIEKNRLILSMDVESWLNQVAEIACVRFIPIDNEISIKANILPGEFHKDPADRMIVATARKYAAPLVTADQKILAYPHVKTIW